MAQPNTTHAPNTSHNAQPIPKSWKRKYRKLHKTFLSLSTRSDQLFAHSQKLSALLVRLNENVEDLTFLLDVNRKLSKGEPVNDADEARMEEGLLGQGPNGTRIPAEKMPAGLLKSRISAVEEGYASQEEDLEEDILYEELGPEKDDIEVPAYMEEERNPQGVLEWLKRNQPQVFLQEIEGKRKAEEGDFLFVNEKKGGKGGKKAAAVVSAEGEGKGIKRKRASTMAGQIVEKKPAGKRRKKSPA